MPSARLPAAIVVLCAGGVAALSARDSFRQCLVSRPSPGLGQCLGAGAIGGLQSWDADAEFDIVDGVSLKRDAQEYREAYNFADRDPSDPRSIVDTVDHVFSHRSMLWDMSFLYPGLSLRMTPPVAPGPVLEFAVDAQREALNVQSLKEASTARILTRQFVLPLLLGFKFKAVSLIPILFGFLALLAKKAVIICKLALIVSSALGLSSLLFGGQGSYYGQPSQYYTNHHYNTGLGGHYRYPDEYPEVLYRGVSAPLAATSDQLHLVGDLRAAYDRSAAATAARESPELKGRNFAWSEDEKATKKAAP